MWIVLIAGEPTEKAAKSNPWLVRKMDWVAWSTAITEKEYLELLEDHTSRPTSHPLADAHSPVDWRQGKPIF